MMSSWLVLGAVLLLALAALARILAIIQDQMRWDTLAIGSRAAAAVAVGVALVLSILAGGDGSPLSLGPLSLGLALAISLTHLALIWRLAADGASPVADLLALSVLLGGWVSGSDAPALTCLQQVLPFYVQWALFLVGVGAALVSGSAGLLLYLHAFLTRGDRASRLPPARDLHSYLGHASALALVALGSGLALGVWWAWRAMGSLYGGEPREIWMASASLISAASLLSWQTGRRSGLGAAGLSVVAAIIGLVGLLV